MFFVLIQTKFLKQQLLVERWPRASLRLAVWRKGYIFHSPEGERAAEVFYGLFSHTDGKMLGSGG
jgi:hypothetical protein